MRKTTNYELNIAEGSDRYNHLTIDNLNYEKIDTTMKQNEDNAVQTATELKNGTVHAITRNKPNASMFRFVATSDYTSGETFTVDGQQVTALLPNGAALGTGAYHINSNVLCCLVGTNMTVYTIGVAENIDASTLEGHSADYFATNSALNAVKSTAESAGIVANNALSKVSDINIVKEKIWENPSTSPISTANFNLPYNVTDNIFILTFLEDAQYPMILSTFLTLNEKRQLITIWENGTAYRYVTVKNDSIEVSPIHGTGSGKVNSSLIPTALYRLVVK